MKPTKQFLFPQIDLMILRTHVPQLIHDLVIHSVLLIMGRLAPFPGGSPPFFRLPLRSKKSFQNDFLQPLHTTFTHFTTRFLFNADP